MIAAVKNRLHFIEADLKGDGWIVEAMTRFERTFGLMFMFRYWG